MPTNPTPVEVVRLAATYYHLEANRLEVARQEWGLNEWQFYAVANAAIDDPTVALELPTEVKRLRRLRDVRQAQRAPRVA